MKEIEVKSIPSTFKKGGKQCHQLFVKNSKPVSAAEFIARFGERLGKSKADARYINDIHGQVLSTLLAENKAVNTGTLRAFLTIGGSVSDPTAALSPEENPVNACILPLGELKDAVRDFVAVNVTETIEAILYTLQYDGSSAMNTIEGDGTVVMTGVGLTLTDKADEGVWLEDADGVVVSEKATITMNDTNVIECAFSDLPEAGNYRLVIATRDGGSPDKLGITRVVRKVVVK